MAATVKSRIDPKKYARLVSRARPAVIETGEENERILAAVERLAGKDEDNLLP